MNVTHKLLLVLLLALAGGCAKAPTDRLAADGKPHPSAAASETEASNSKSPGAESQGGERASTERPDTKEARPESANAAITPEAAQQAGIEVAAAGPAQIRETLTLYGSIKSNAERQQEIRARYPGVVRSIAKRAGDAVSKGEELLTVESNESLQVYAIRSPLNGQVLDRRANPGDAVDGATVLMTVADLSSVWVEFALFARDLGHVRAGMPVLFRGASAEERGEAKITYVAPAGHADTQSVVARAVIDNRSGRWVPGQFITGDIVIAEANVPVAVKPVALQQLQGKTMVFVQNGRGFEARPVHVGKRSRDAVEITNGLAAGERYAATNSYLIKADLMKGEAEED
jgi:cobalt-zinc-cadmium efflux system membrane fusion protein